MLLLLFALRQTAGPSNQGRTGGLLPTVSKLRTPQNWHCHVWLSCLPWVYIVANLGAPKVLAITILQGREMPSLCYVSKNDGNVIQCALGGEGVLGKADVLGNAAFLFLHPGGDEFSAVLPSQTQKGTQRSFGSWPKPLKCP